MIKGLEMLCLLALLFHDWAFVCPIVRVALIYFIALLCLYTSLICEIEHSINQMKLLMNNEIKWKKLCEVDFFTLKLMYSQN